MSREGNSRVLSHVNLKTISKPSNVGGRLGCQINEHFDFRKIGVDNLTWTGLDSHKYLIDTYIVSSIMPY